MANLQVKGIDNALYEQMKILAAGENRSVSQEVIFLLRKHLATQKSLHSAPSPAELLLQLSGSWEDARPAEEIIVEIREARENSARLTGGF